MFNSEDSILFDNNPVPMWIYDRDTHQILKVNKSAVKRYGYSREEFLSLSVGDLTNRETLASNLNIEWENPQNSNYTGIWKHLTKSGKEFYVEIFAQAFDFDGRKVELVQAREIALLKESVNQLQSIQKELLYHLQNSPLGVIEWDSQFLLKRMNDKINEITEFSFDELTGRSAKDLAHSLVHPADVRKTLQQIEALRSGESSQVQLNIRISTKYDTLKYIQLYNTALVDQDGELRSVFTLMEDRTDQKILEKSRERLHEMIEATPDLIATIDPDGYLLYMNSAGRELFEIDNEPEPYQYHIEDFNPRQSLERLEEQILPTAKRDGVWKGILELNTLESERSFLTSTVIIGHKNENNEIEYYSAIFRDISQQLRDKSRLKEQNTRLSLAMEGGQVGFWNYYPKNQEMNVDTDWVEETLGYTKSELSHEAGFWTHLIHPEDQKASIDKFRKVLDGEISFYETEVRLKKNDGRWTWILVRAKVVVRDKQGQALRVSGIYFDIDGKKRAELRLKEEYKNQQVVKDIALIVNSDLPTGQAMQSVLARIARYLEWPVSHIFYGETIFSSSKVWYLENGAENRYRPFVKATEQVEFKPDEDLVGKVVLSDTIHWFNLEEDAPNFKRADAARVTGISHGVLLSVIVKGKIVALLEFYGPNKIEKTDQLRETLDTVRILLGRLLERKEFLEALKNEKVRYQLLAENSTDMISRHSPEGVFLYVSPAVKPLLGYEPEELMGKSSYEYIHPDDISTVKAKHREMLGNHIVNTITFRYKTKDGVYKWVETTSKPIRDPETGEIIEIQSSTRDISERKKFERQLKDEKEFISTAIESLPGLFYMIDEDQNYVLWNKNFEETFGYSSEEIEQMHPLDFYQEKDHELITSKIQEVLETGEAEVEVDIYDKQGRAIRHFVTGRKFESEGETYIVGSGVNINSRVEAENQLQLHDTLLNQLFEHAPVGLVHLDSEDRIISANLCFENMFRYNRKEIEGAYLEDLIKPSEERINIEGIPPNPIESQGHFQYESIRLRKDNSEIPVLIGTVPVYLESTRVAKYMIYVDITHRKDQEKRLREMLREKRVLLQEIHHRVKNNLAVISGLLQMKGYSSDNTEVQEALTESQQRIKTIALIHEKLYQSETLSDISFDQYLKELADTVKESMDIKNQIDLSIECDPVQLNVTQAVPCALIINELLTNAIEHAFNNKNEGQIAININKNGENIKVAVQDNGSGLPSKIDINSTSSLGFTIIRSLVKQLGANLDIKNGKGTVITFKFSKKGKKLSAESVPVDE